jgi:TatD DNase family protein
MAHMIDTHCHLNFDAYAENRDTIIQAAAAVGVTRIIIPAVDVASSQQAIELTQQYPGIFAAVGVHPNSTADFSATVLAQIAELSYQPKIIAIGEIGLDYYRDKSPKGQQLAAFEAQLELARKRELPVIIHNRDASADVLHILEQWVQDLPPGLKNRPGVLHSFSASQAIADRALVLGFYLGFTGPITFNKAEDFRKIARSVPLDKILVETDAPFLTPEPYRGKFPNKPEYIPYIVDRLAGLKNIPTDAMAAATTENALRLFGLPH